MPGETDPRVERLNLIYDYAKFHIGLYATVGTALTAIITFAPGEYKRQYYGLFLFVTLCFLLAGIGGGLVASHIVYSKGGEAEVKKLLDGFTEPTWPPFVGWSRYKWYAFVEHYAFWLGVVAGVGWAVWRWYNWGG